MGACWLYCSDCYSSRMNEVSSNEDDIIGCKGPNHHADDDRYLGFSSERNGKPWWGGGAVLNRCDMIRFIF